MPEVTYVRIKDRRTKHEYTVPSSVLADVPKESYTVLKKAAVDANGHPLPAKPHISLSPASDRSSESKADEAGSDEENE